VIKMNSILKLIELTNSKIEDIVIIVLGSMTPMIIRMLPNNLRKRGINLEMFPLV